MEKDKTEGGEKDEGKGRGRPAGLVTRERTWSGGQGAVMKSMDDYLKRKREEETEGEGETTEVFKKSNLIARSPQKEKEIKTGEERREKEINLKEVMTEMMGMKKEMSNMAGVIREGFKDQGRMMKLEMEELRKEYKEHWTMWREEREELKRDMEEMKERIRGLEERKAKEGEKNKEREAEIIRKTTEKWREEGEREKRKRNIVIKGVEEKEKEAREVVEELWRLMEVDAETEEIKEIGKGEGRGGRMIRVKLRERADKMQIMRKKKVLKGRKEKIQDDWTFKEREIQWNLEKIAWEERKKGKATQVRYGRIWKEGRWWKWNEDKETLIEGEIEGLESYGGEREHRMETEEGGKK